MKKLIAATLALMLCLSLLAACGGQEQSNNGSGTTSGAVHRDTLTVALSREPKTLIPHESNDTGTAPVTHQYCESLLQVNTEGEVEPCLATSWEMIDDTHYRFHLREGVKFSDGSDFTAEDVLFTLEKCVESPSTSSSVGPIDIANSTIEDDHTVVIALSEPCPPFVNFMSLDICGIVSKKAMEADPEGYAKQPIGTGPFKFVEWATGDYIKLEANKDWWGGEVNFDTLMLRIIPEGATRAIEAESGGVDLAHITITDVPTVDEDENVDLMIQPIYNTSFVSFNCSVKPFDNLKVRQAISLALDCDAIVKAVYGEYADVADSFLSPAIWGYHSAESEFQGHDVEKAKKLLEEAGYGSGFSCTMISNGNQALAEMIQAQLGEIGVNVTLNVTDFANWLDALVNGKQEMYIGGWTCPSGDASEAFDYFESANFGAGGNRSYYANDEADRLIKIIDTETDTDKRMQACVDAQELLADECVTVGLNVGAAYWAVSKDIQGYVVLPSQSPDFAHITFAK